MPQSFAQLNDLPDEFFMIILKKLHNIEALYSLIGFNTRLNTTVLDSIFTRHLTITRPFNGFDQLPDAVLDRFCLEILPKIHDKIEWIDVESPSLERVLFLINYPNLNGLGLYDLSSERARDLFTMDERSFEHEFFIQIAQCFPCLKKFILHNREAQKNENQQWSIVNYPHLIELDLVRVHENYVEQFLDERKMSLPNDVYLLVNYNILEKVTHTFTRDATRMNCSKINHLLLFNEPDFALNLKDYFPNAKIEW
ncbi:hypothetical protein I4U23_023276 [Adineta vaga]|nr:hypothetical protein I4U23_023276 [Adineta vaga]